MAVVVAYTVMAAAVIDFSSLIKVNALVGLVSVVFLRWCD